MKVAVYGRKLKLTVAEKVQEVFNQLEVNGFQYTVYAPFKRHLQRDLKTSIRSKETYVKKGDFKEKVDFVFCLGGDGTILDAVTWVGHHEIPIMGINFGRLGFLASISQANISKAIQSVKKGRFEIDERSMLIVNSNNYLFGETNFALNEFTVQRKETSSMITVQVYLNGQHLNAYWADGLIISTATGSTGYSLSCGGPIIHPDSNNFIITPVAPHNLNVRPMVVSDDVVLTLEVQGRSKQFLATLDSRFQAIDKTYEIAIKKAPFKAKLVRLSSDNFLNAIREKLLWGSDQRN